MLQAPVDRRHQLRSFTPLVPCPRMIWADAAHVSAGVGDLELGLPGWAAELRLDLLVKINSKLSGENGGSDHDLGKLPTNVVGRAESQSFAHCSTQAFQAFTRTLCQTQSAVGQSIIPITLAQSIRKCDDPGIGSDQRQIGVG